MNNALLAIGALLIAALAALFAVPYAVDWNSYRGVFEEEASRILGRDVRVGGKVDVRLLPVPYVAFGKLRVADAVNETGEPLFRADSFTMWLSVPPLLRGVLEARAVELKKPVLRLVVDPEKGGNWASQGAATGTGALPFLPQAVALQSVRVTDGAVVVSRANATPLAELAAIDGELEAEALEGPFRFKGNARWNGAPREVRLATAKMDADGSLRFKTTVRVTDTANAYVLEGRLSDLKSRPRLDGEITGKIALPSVAAAAAAKTAPAAERPLVDLRADVEADGTGFKLKNLALSLDNVGQPQLVSGETQMSWVARPALGARLGSKLLDLDRISGARDEASTLHTARGLLSSLVGALPTGTDVSLFLVVDQATLNKQSVSGVSLLLEEIDGKLTLKDLKAGVPGGGRLDAYGTFAADAGHAFAGQVALRGSSLNRFLEWAAKGSGAPRADGPFLLQGKLDLADAAVSLTDASAEIGGAALAGEVRYTSAEREKLTVTLDGRRVDTGQLWAMAGRSQDTADPFRDLLPRGLLTGAAVVAKPQAGMPPAASGSAQPPLRVADFGALDVALRVRAGELVAGALTLKNADADLAIERGKLTLTALKGTTADGLGLEIEGDVANFAKEPKGALRWVVTAPSEQALAALNGLAGFDLQEASAKRLAAALLPVRLAGTTRLGADTGKTTVVVFDGQTRTGRVDGRLRLDGDRQAWRAAPLDLSLALESEDAAGLLRAVVPGAVPREPKSAERQPGRIEVKSVGQADSGLKTLVTVGADGLAATFDGRVSAPATGTATAAGRLRLEARDARLPASLLGLTLGSGTRSALLKGEGELTVAADTTSFLARRLDIAGTRVDGSIAVAQGTGKTKKLTADIGVDAANLTTLLALVSDAQPGEPPTAAEAAPRPGWPAAPIDFALLDGLDATVKARFAKLQVQPGAALTNAELETRLEPRRITVSKLTGEALQGRVTSRLAIERQPATIAVKGDIDFLGLKLDALTAVEEARRARGTADVRLDITAEGLTPASLIASAKGKGEVRLSDAEIGGFSADAVTAVADAVLAGKTEREGEGLTRALREAFGQGTLKIGAQKLAVEVVDGAARLAPLTLASEQGRTTLLATADLGQMKVDGEWRIEPRTPPAPASASAAAQARGALPAVSMIYVGGLGNLAAIEPKLSSGALERELNVRRMEREVEELERLRKADEERARAAEEERKRQEAERLKAQQAQQAEGAAAQSPTPAQSPATTPPPNPTATPTPAPPTPAPAWSGSTSVTPSPGGGAADGTGGAASSAPPAFAPSAEPSPAAAAADAGQPKEAAKSERPAGVTRPKPAPKPRQDSLNNLYKQWN